MTTLLVRRLFNTDYLGYALLVSWFYGLWFAPNSFALVDHNCNEVGILWTVMTVSFAVSLFALAVYLKPGRHLRNARRLLVGACAVLAASTAVVSFSGMAGAFFIVSVICSAAAGVTYALLWMAWGESHALGRTSFDIGEAVPTIALVQIVVLACCAFLPVGPAGLFVSLLPLASGVLLIRSLKAQEHLAFPPMAFRRGSSHALDPVPMVCFSALVLNLACFYVHSLLPVDSLSLGRNAVLLGASSGMATLIVLYIIFCLSSRRLTIARMLPWLLVVVIVSYGLYFEERCADAVFLLTDSVSTALSILLLVYFMALANKGYLSVSVAFSLAGGVPALGMGFGDLVPFLFQGNPAAAETLEGSLTLVLFCLLAVSSVPLVRQEQAIAALSAPSTSEADIDRLCAGLSAEHSLSKRESEVLGYLVRGYTAGLIAEKLGISVRTVNAHTQRVYDKCVIHKRSELLRLLDG